MYRKDGVRSREAISHKPCGHPALCLSSKLVGAYVRSYYTVVKVFATITSLTVLLATLPTAYGALCESPSNITKVSKEWEAPCDTSFSYCTKNGPVEGKCPVNPSNRLSLVYNPEKLKCDLSHDCTVSKDATVKLVTVLNETDGECLRQGCRLYPGSECNTYYVCSGGVKINKQCWGDLIFDYKNRECKNRDQAKCWQDVITITPIVEQHKQKPKAYCPFHGREPTQSGTPAEPSLKNNVSGLILPFPQVTNYGEWQPWSYCTKGSYFTGMSIWRRTTDADGKFDHAGVISLGFKCDNPIKKGKGEVIGQFAVGAPDSKWFDFMTCDAGAAIGFQLSQQEDQGVEGDDLATDSVKMFCSCGKEPIKVKPYHEPRPEYQRIGGLRGKWSPEQHCKPKQAMCGFRTQMQKWKKEKVVDITKLDMTGLNQMSVKCCDVPPPGKCTPKENKIYLETCDNRDSEITRICPVTAFVGVQYNDKFERAISFYESVGFTINDSLPLIQSSVESSGVKCESSHFENNTCVYTWDNVAPRIYGVGQLEKSKIQVKSGVNVRLFQVVADCGVYTIHTNKLIKVRQNMEGKELRDQFNVF